jgi:hypothetical protein
MEAYFFSAALDEERTLFLAPLTERRRQRACSELEDASGYFLFEKRGCGDDADIEILARVESDDAALRLRELLRLT